MHNGVHSIASMSNGDGVINKASDLSSYHSMANPGDYPHLDMQFS